MAEQVWAKPQAKTQVRGLPAVRARAMPSGLVSLSLMAAALVVMAASYQRSAQPVTLSVNGESWQARTHQQTVGAFLREAGLSLRSEDIVLPPLDTPLSAAATIVVQRALPVVVQADGHLIERYTHSQTVADALYEAGVDVKPYDVVLLNGQAVGLDVALPRGTWRPSRWPLLRDAAARASDSLGTTWTRIQVQRAIPLSITDGGVQTVIHTVARTIGEALLDQGIILYLGDRVQPMLGALLTAGMHVEIHRAKPVTLHVDGRVIRTRTQATDVGQLLSELGIQLLGKDYTVPSLAEEVAANMAVRVVRVVEDWIVESQDINFETVWRSDSTLELDLQRTTQRGQKGVRKRRTYIVYEDGVEKSRQVVEEWIERQPVNHIISYGTKIVIRELETPHGTIRYWRKLRVLATSYTAATSGKSRDHPEYGITRLGWQARKGIIAVDPTVIKLRTNMYVPGYGFGVAADTGGMIKGRWIDLCYDEDNLVLWKRWVDVYLLEPVPPAKDITWILPSYPTERR